MEAVEAAGIGNELGSFGFEHLPDRLLGQLRMAMCLGVVVQHDHPPASVTTLKAVLDAFNAHDLDLIMPFFSDDCVLKMPRGPDPWGRRLVGSNAVRERLRSRFSGIPDVQYKDDTHFVCGEIGVSQWTLRGTSTDGQPVEVRGCDFFTFKNGKIAKKDSYWKIREVGT
jgi:ketosteroid isomerase-like protein